MRILLVEDDIKIASFIIKGMKAAGFAVDHAADGEEGLHMALTEPYDTAIIDIMLPKRDGLSIIEEMRKERISMPVIILSAKGSIDDRVKGLQTGSDDYLTKPLAFSELLARVQPGGKADTAGIQSGDVIKEVNRKPVTAPKDVKKQIDKVRSGDTVQMLIKRPQAGLIVLKIPV